MGLLAYYANADSAVISDEKDWIYLNLQKSLYWEITKNHPFGCGRLYDPNPSVSSRISFDKLRYRLWDGLLAARLSIVFWNYSVYLVYSSDFRKGSPPQRRVGRSEKY